MLIPRIIPVLLIENRDLVKSLNFQNNIYVGDPINTIKIYNEKKIDELIVYDITKTNEKRIDYDFIKILAKECNMPLCYGGNIENVDQIEKILSLGVEKISLNTSLFSNPNFVKNASNKFGKQSIVATFDIKKKSGEYFIFTESGKKKINNNLISTIKELQLSVGEIIIQSIDRDGTMQGYDIDLFNYISKYINIPFTFVGGAGKIDHIEQIIKRSTIAACGCASFFIFKKKRGSVLINYISQPEREILNKNFKF